MKFKVGDLVDTTNCSYMQQGTVTRVENEWVYFRDECGNECFHLEKNVKLVKRGDSMDNLQKGDVVIESDGDEQTVLARLEDCVLLSIYNDSTYTSNWSTIQELKNLGYKLKSDTPQELTVEEISEKLGYEVKVVKNKK